MAVMSKALLLCSYLSLLVPSAHALSSSDGLLDVEQPLIKLRPQHSSSRNLLNLDGLWKFAIVPEPKNTTEIRDPTPQWAAPLSTDLECPVPASYNDIFLDQAIHDHVGWVIYQRNVLVPPGWSPKDRYILRAESATHRGRMYVNDRPVADHQGGYTPFEADITEMVDAGKEFRLTIAVNNVLTYETLPPGRVLVNEYTGQKEQDYFHDFFNYAGLARSVWIYSVPQNHIEDITLTTDVDGDTGKVHYDIQVSQPADGTLNVSMVDQDGVTVATGSGLRGTLHVESAKLWQPGLPYLYQFQANIVDASEDMVDTYSVATGIRTVEVRGTEFLINGKPFYFTGFGKHEDSPVRGKGHDQSYMVHDFELLDWIGANSFRTSHYPYSEDVMDFADKHGLVVIDETPAVGVNVALNAGQGRQESESTFAPERINNRTREAHKQAIRELISRDKNHASVVMWSIANEPASRDDGAREYFQPLTELARELDPIRPITFANTGVEDGVLSTAGVDNISDLFDVTMINLYFGWYALLGDLTASEIAIEETLSRWETRFPRPIIMSEYGADTISGLHSTTAAPWSEEFQTDILEATNRVMDRIGAMAGEHVWNFRDFETALSVRRVNGNKKGIFTRDRKPKAAAQMLKRRWSARNTSGFL